MTYDQKRAIRSSILKADNNIGNAYQHIGVNDEHDELHRDLLNVRRELLRIERQVDQLLEDK